MNNKHTIQPPSKTIGIIDSLKCSINAFIAHKHLMVGPQLKQDNSGPMDIHATSKSSIYTLKYDKQIYNINFEPKRSLRSLNMRFNDMQPRLWYS
jgi:hypothetical protein